MANPATFQRIAALDAPAPVRSPNFAESAFSAIASGVQGWQSRKKTTQQNEANQLMQAFGAMVSKGMISPGGDVQYGGVPGGFSIGQPQQDPLDATRAFKLGIIKGEISPPDAFIAQDAASKAAEFLKSPQGWLAMMQATKSITDGGQGITPQEFEQQTLETYMNLSRMAYGSLQPDVKGEAGAGAGGADTKPTVEESRAKAIAWLEDNKQELSEGNIAATIKQFNF